MFSILDMYGAEAFFYWRSEYETVEEVEQEIFEHFNQLPLFVERV